MQRDFETIAIVGMGLIGGSVALAARRQRLTKHVIGVSRNPAAIEALLGSEQFPDGLVDSATSSLAEACRGAQLILLCTPPSTIVELAQNAAAAAAPGTLISDVASTKLRIAESLGANLVNDCHFVGGHPLAGRHASGPMAARADLFKDSCVILTPTADVNRAAVERLAHFWSALGAQVIEMGALEHDRQLAASSHLPHVVASALAAATPAEAVPLTAGGWRDTTRVAEGNPELWAEILLDNQEAVVRELGRFTNQLAEFRAAMENGNRQALLQCLRRGKERRDALGS